tara:strand:- start:56 stop:1093 length:1038 start_codon:yes stop_codon:yes gene_type:complete
MRRYDIDWLRVLVLGLLILYHATISFMPFGIKLFFPQNKQTLEILWFIMALINIWRIPLLFIISGMAVCFSMKRRNWKEMFKDRGLRIMVPYIFGVFVICPISILSQSIFYGGEISYTPNPGHLWFLNNIWVYFCCLIALFVYLQKNPNNLLLNFLKKIFMYRLGIYIMVIPFIIEVILITPDSYSSYAYSIHGWVLGLICFFTGYIFILLKENFWEAVSRVKNTTLIIAFLLYLVRVFLLEFVGFHPLTAIESYSWMISIFGYGAKFLNKQSTRLSYLSTAVYPIYILHMPLQFFFSLFIIPWDIPAILKLILIIMSTLISSFAIYDLVIKRLKWIRPLFGLKI